MQLSNFRTIIFDCEGVILNSNNVKTEAFYSIAKIFSKKKAEKLVEYHLSNGGVSRYEKINYFCQNIMKLTSYEKLYHKLLIDFSNYIKSNILLCETSSYLGQLKNDNHYSDWMVVSGSDQLELEWILKKKRIDHFFN